MNTEKCRAFIVKALYWAILAVVVYIVFEFGIPYLFPFIFALIVASLLHPLAGWLSGKLKLPQKLTAAVLVTLVYILLAFLIVLTGATVVAEVRDLVLNYNTKVVPFISGIFESIERLFNSLAPEAAETVSNFAGSVINGIGSRLATASAALLGKVLTAAPQTLLRVIITVISTYFIAMDFSLLGNGLLCRMSEERATRLVQSVSHFKKTLMRFVGSYALIFLITFAQLAVGLLLVGIEDWWLIALVVAVFDVLPIVGSGMVMLPWALITLARGTIGTGLGLLAVWLFVVVSRQFIEPRIVGQRVGLHPLITLVAMTVGFRLFGGIGLIGFPLICALLVSMDSEGVIKLFPNKHEMPSEAKAAKRKWFKGKAADPKGKAGAAPQDESGEAPNRDTK